MALYDRFKALRTFGPTEQHLRTHPEDHFNRLEEALGVLGGVVYADLDATLADNKSRIDAAMAVAVAQGGGVVQLPAGTFKTNKIALPSNVHIRGAGMGLTILQMVNGAANGSHVISVADETGATSYSKMRISDLTIDGNRANQSQPTLQGVNLRNCHDLLVENVEFKECVGYGLVIQQNSSRYIVRNCYVHDSGGGFYQQKNTTIVEFARWEHCLSEDNDIGGFASFACEEGTYINCISRSEGSAAGSSLGGDSNVRVSYIGCQAIDCVGAGFGHLSNIVPGPPASPQSVQIIGCSVKNAAEAGIRCNNAKDLVISGCVIDGAGTNGTGDVAGILITTSSASLTTKRVSICGNVVTRSGRQGINLRGSRNVVISGNVVMNSSQAVGSQPGIYIEADAVSARDIIISGNRIGDDQAVATQTRGVRITTTSSNVSIIGNDFTGNAAFPILLDSFTGSQIRCHDNIGLTAISQASAATFDPDPFLDSISVTGTTNITTLGVTHAYPGRRIRLRFTDGAPPDLIHGNNIHLAAGANFNPASAHEIIELETDGVDYREVSRSANT